MIKFVRDLRQVGGFFPGTPVSSTDKTDRHDITELLLVFNATFNNILVISCRSVLLVEETGEN